MLEETSEGFVQSYVESCAKEMQADLLEVIDIMKVVSPNAEVVSDLGIPYFQQNATLLYGVAAREDHLCVYFSNANLLHTFVNRLRPAQFGNNCLIIRQLSDININVFVELLRQMKVHFECNHREEKELI
jgi:uncharacterized protein YdhG (YjbR/CyaY superfamily)